MNNLVKRLCEVDCIIYPEWKEDDSLGNVCSRAFHNINKDEIINEIIALRLTMMHYSSCNFNVNDTNYSDNLSIENDSAEIQKFNKVKQIKNILQAINPMLIDENLISMEIQQCRILNDKLNRSDIINDETKLTDSYIKLKKLEPGCNSDKIKNDFENLAVNERIKLFDKEIEKILGCNKPSVNENLQKAGNSELFKNVFNLIMDMVKTTGQSCGKINSKDTYSEKDVINYLNDIHKWIKANKELMSKTHTQLNNSVKKLSTKLNREKSLAKMADNNFNSDDSLNLEDEKAAFNKAFMMLEERINEIKVEKVVESPFSVNFDELKDKNREELIQIVLASERDLAAENWNDKSDKEALKWLETRSEDELKEDCKSLLHKLMMNKINEIFQSKSKPTKTKQTRKDKPSKDDRMMSLEDEISAKLRKYQEICETVENLKISKSENENKISVTGSMRNLKDLNNINEEEFVERQVYRSNMSESKFPSGAVDSRYLTIPDVSGKRLSLPKTLLSESPVYGYSNNTSNSLVHFDYEKTTEYFHRRIKQLQQIIESQQSLNHQQHLKNQSSCDQQQSKYKLNSCHDLTGEIITDGFEIEESHSARYYSMQLQDLHHDRIHDELSGLLHHMDKHQAHLIQDNKELMHHNYLSQNLIQSLQNQLHLIQLANTDRNTRTNQANSDDSLEYLQEENNRLCQALHLVEQQMDQQNIDLVDATGRVNSLDNDNHNLLIKNQNLQRTLRKLEEQHKDLIEQLSQYQHSNVNSSYVGRGSRLQSPKHTNSNHFSPGKPFGDVSVSGGEAVVGSTSRDPSSGSLELHQKYMKSERDKVELVRKLDMIDQQNRLLKEHCEKLDNELLKNHKKLGEERRTNQSLKDELAKVSPSPHNSKRPSYDSRSMLNIAAKDEELLRLRNKISQLESRLALNQEPAASARLKEEMLNQKEKEITKLRQEIGTFRDLLEEARAQMDVKDFENRKLVTKNKQLQNQLNEGSYFPPTGYKLVKE